MRSLQQPSGLVHEGMRLAEIEVNGLQQDVNF